MAGLVLDGVLVAVLVAQAVTGWRQGLLVGVASLAGFGVGLTGGAALVGELLGSDLSGPVRLLAVLAGGLLGGIGLQALGVAGAYSVRRRLESRPAVALDAVVGMILAVVVASLVVWVISWGLRTAPLPTVGRVVTESRVVTGLDAAAPPWLQQGADRFFARVSGEWLPRVFSAGREPIREVPSPDSAVVDDPDVQAAAGSVVKIRGRATACGRFQEGSGFVVAPGTVVTNAHVVAGMPEPSVQVGGIGRFLPAVVVAFDPVRDLAVLDVADLEAAPLGLAETADPGQNVAVAGFPNDGPYVVTAGRIRDRVTAVGDDIYGAPGARREVYALFATVQPGNSGGPVIAEDGRVVGVVFARSTTSPSPTGYALTVDELRPLVPAGGPAGTRPAVDVGGCAVG